MGREDTHQHSFHTTPQGRLFISLALTLLVFGGELWGGIFANSLALLSDAWHVLTDAVALGLALLALVYARKEPTPIHTYGFHRLEVIVAFINGISLWGITLWILIEAGQRLLHPVDVRGREMFIVAAIGLAANLLAGVLLHRHGEENLNIRGAWLHVMADALGSVGVLVGGWLVLRYGWYLADPLISIGISLLIMRGAYNLTREALHILMEGTPAHLKTEEVLTALEAVEGVANVHDLHIWNISGRIPALSAHLLVNTPCASYPQILACCQKLLAEKFGIFHSTLQLEPTCPLAEKPSCQLLTSGNPPCSSKEKRPAN